MTQSQNEPLIIERASHSVSRSMIDPDALYIMRKLRREGYDAYLVGGAVRDMLIGREPKDFDIGTDATPTELRALFPNSRIIGRRFRIIHVYFRRRGEPEKVIEVSTFRGKRRWDEGDKVHPDDLDQTGTAFGTPTEDAWRRDFTVNALFYNLDDFTLIDHTGGLADLEAGIIRLIGDPDERFAEDPVRMLRAIEFAVRLGFEIEEGTRLGIMRNAGAILEASPARIREELRQMHQRGITGEVLERASALGLFGHLFPSIEPTEPLFSLMKHLDGLADGANGLEYAYIAALVLPSVESARPLGEHANLEEVHAEVYPLVGGICDRYQISAHIRHLARELIMCCYRLSRGKRYRSKGKFAKRSEFAFAISFYEAWVTVSGGDREALEFWKLYLSERTGEGVKKSNRRKRRPRHARKVFRPPVEAV